jgi:two-component system cell cycle response regulator DivK
MNLELKRKVLIIEDNEQNLYLVTFLLESKGYEVIPARDGYSAIDLIKSVNPDVILLDIQLPGMDGFEVLRVIRDLPQFAQIPVIAVTSHAMAGDRYRMLNAGCTDYIEKPIDPDSFVDQIEKNFCS